MKDVNLSRYHEILINNIMSNCRLSYTHIAAVCKATTVQKVHFKTVFVLASYHS